MSATLTDVEDIHSKLMEKLAPQEPEKEEPALQAAEESQETEEPLENEAEPLEAEAQESEPSESIELSHIAEYLGANEDQFTTNEDGDLMIRTKIDGNEGQAKFNDILKSYQLEGHLNKQSTELAETQKTLQSKIAEANEQLTSKVQQLEDLSQIAYNELLTDYNKVNWDELRADDPAEFAAKKTDYQVRQTQIASLYQKAQDQRQEIQATDTEGLKEKIQDEGKKLLKAIPDWTDSEKYQKGWSDTGAYAQSMGFSKEEFSSTVDHRMIVILNKARQFDELQKGTPEITKKVRKAPKIAKPGSTATKVTTDQVKNQKLKAQLKRDGGGKALHEILLGRV